ncbi:unnamed protein product [Rotaria socialis]|uniref:BPTI/Kunitz inhibitor domain-containing protein n=1 Tax=Rotaria socialis TaxID=392032 RepID=A0A817KG07_9BILA|nr:unnamed protein product [Rotaria socialis]CAF3184169.1 unnamed protein product [Rotaria socialis]CAF3312179.1 unnamed protein product [Rotaria socialis]CAF3335306.1 unnamed protein product [Rotaria socialis]CAF3453045.1 unnamed protein product [Rotaria socialis]
MIRIFSIVFISLTLIYAIESYSLRSATDVGSKTAKACAPVKCPGKPKSCPYGYQKKDGCEICRCSDPCNPPGKPILCGAKQRCYVDKKSDGTFEGRCGAPPKKANKHKKKEKTTTKDDCNLPKMTGPCRASFPRFFYNPATQSCESFVYGGCRGNKNNFNTKVECDLACVA